MLRSPEWIADCGAHVGGTVWLNMPEMGVEGEAEVLDIGPAQVYDVRPGLVTGTFRHTSGEVYDLKLASETKPIGVTGTHPFWSVSREAWVSVLDLEIGETLKTLEGTTVVESRVRRPEPEAVYNIEVEGDYCYRVGESGVLVHNASAKKSVQVGYGSTDLSKLAQSIRKAGSNYSLRNLAIFEYRDGNDLKTVCAFSRSNLQYVRDLGHSERRIAKWLERNKIPFCAVTRIYSELAPCTVISCDKFVEKNFPQAKVTWSFEYGARDALTEAQGGTAEEMETALELDQESRRIGSKQFEDAMAALEELDVASSSKRCV